jgi:hypothetical protein
MDQRIESFLADVLALRQAHVSLGSAPNRCCENITDPQKLPI